MNIYVYLINTLYFLTKWIPFKIKNLFLNITCFLLSTYYILYNTYYSKDFLYNYGLHKRIVMLFLLVLILLFSINKEVKTISWNKKLVILYFIFPIAILINSIFFKTNDTSFYTSFELLFVFPCYYIVFNNNRNYKDFFKKISFSFTLSCCLYYVLCFILATDGKLIYENTYLRATINNTNVLGFISMNAVLSAIYLLYSSKKTKVSNFYYFLTISIGINLILFAGCRSAILVIIFSFLIVAIFYFKTTNHMTFCNCKTIIKYFSILFVLMIIVFNTTKIMIDINTQNNSEYRKNGIYSNEIITHSVSKVNKSNTYENGISTGRFNIWKNYILNIRIVGHDCDDYAFLDYLPHNNYIEVSYFYGLIAGLAYTTFCIFIGIKSVILLFNKNITEDIFLYIVIIVVSFTIQSLIEIAVELDGQAITLLYYFVLSYFFDKKKYIY